MVMNVRIEIKKSDGSVETIEWKGISIKHFRDLYWDKKTKKLVANPSSGLTIVAFNRNGHTEQAWSKCHTTDRFNKKMGIITAIYEYANRHLVNRDMPMLQLDKWITPNAEFPDQYFFYFSDKLNKSPYWFQKPPAKSMNEEIKKFYADLRKVKVNIVDNPEAAR